MKNVVMIFLFFLKIKFVHLCVKFICDCIKLGMISVRDFIHFKPLLLMVINVLKSEWKFNTTHKSPRNIKK